MTYVASHVDESTWPEVPLGSLVTFHSGGTPSKGNPAFWRGSIPWVSAKDMKSFRLSDTQDHITAEGAANGTRVVPRGSVLLLTRGMTLLNSVPVCLLDRDMAFNQDVKALQPSSRILPDYLPYLVLGNAARLKNMVDLAGHGTGRLNSEELKALNVRVPPMGDQGAIAHILGALDDKIELNRRMNETLEAMARTLFKSWFVDFEPARAKMAGRDTGLPPSLATLFPAELAQVDARDVPVGWHLGTLAEIAIARRQNVAPADCGEETPYISLENMPRRSIALCSWGFTRGVKSAKSRFQKGDILFGKLRPYFHKVGIAPVDGVCSTDIVVIAPKSRARSAFVAATVSSDEFVSFADQTSTGTRMPRTSWKTMGGYAICMPPGQLTFAYQEAVQPFLDKIAVNVHSTVTLASLRDALLPKLVSGKLRVSDAERLVEAVA